MKNKMFKYRNGNFVLVEQETLEQENPFQQLLGDSWYQIVQAAVLWFRDNEIAIKENLQNLVTDHNTALASANQSDNNELSLKDFIEKVEEDVGDQQYDAMDSLNKTNRTNLSLKDLFEKFKQTDYDEQKSLQGIFEDFEYFIIRKNDETNPVEESKYINPRQPKSLIRHPSLVGFMR